LSPRPRSPARRPCSLSQREAHVASPAEHKPAPEAHPAAVATTGGTLRAAYAQYDVNPDTHDVVLRIRDATTDQVLTETPSREVQAMSKYLNDYAATLSRHRAALKNPAAN